MIELHAVPASYTPQSRFIDRFFSKQVHVQGASMNLFSALRSVSSGRVNLGVRHGCRCGWKGEMSCGYFCCPLDLIEFFLQGGQIRPTSIRTFTQCQPHDSADRLRNAEHLEINYWVRRPAVRLEHVSIQSLVNLLQHHTPAPHRESSAPLPSALVI